MRRPALAVLVVLVLPACDPPSSAPAVSASVSASASAGPAPAAVSALATPAPVPPDLDVAAQQRALKCGGDTKSGACGVLAKMATCAAWNPVVPSGDGRWIGRGWLVEGAKTTDQITLARARRVPTSEVGPGQIGVRIAIADLPKQEGAAFDQADRAIRAYERADVPPRSSPTVEYLKKRTDWSEASALHTVGGQVYALTTNGTYLCQGPSRSVLVFERAGTRSGSADGLYAELWPTSW